MEEIWKKIPKNYKIELSSKGNLRNSKTKRSMNYLKRKNEGRSYLRIPLDKTLRTQGTSSFRTYYLPSLLMEIFTKEKLKHGYTWAYENGVKGDDRVDNIIQAPVGPKEQEMKVSMKKRIAKPNNWIGERTHPNIREKALSLIREGKLSAKEISEKSGMSVSTIRVWRKRLGVED